MLRHNLQADSPRCDRLFVIGSSVITLSSLSKNGLCCVFRASPGLDVLHDSLKGGRSEVAVRFDEKVYTLVRQIPRGQVCAYGDIAAALGSPRQARQVGFALARLPIELSDEVPWHRVINAQGGISGRGDLVRPDLQDALLRSEGVCFNASGRCELATYRFVDFEPL